MLTSMHAQYLNPEYIQLPPKAVDAKESPLALLAQTCSAIGKDPDTTKPVSDKTCETVKTDDTAPVKRSSTDCETEKDNQSDSKETAVNTASQYKDVQFSKSDDSAQKGKEARKTEDVTSLVVSHELPNNAPKLRSESSSLTSSNDASTTVAASVKSDSLSPLAQPPPLYPGYGLPYLGHPIPGIPHNTSAAHMLYPSLTSAEALALSSPNHGYGSIGLTSAHGLSPFAFARMKASSGASTFVPTCRDPYCANCLAAKHSPHSAGVSPCLTASPNAGGLSKVAAVSLPSASNLSAAAHLSAVYGHSALQGHSGLPGYSSLGLTPTGLAASHGLSYQEALSSSLRQAYPRSLSPTSSLLASRYHPYKSPLTSLSSPSSLSVLPSALPPYYSPYAASLYSQRLSAAAAP